VKKKPRILLKDADPIVARGLRKTMSICKYAGILILII
jgi:hypothetical protein